MRKLEVAFTGTFFDDPATLTWTDLSGYWTPDDVLDVQLGRPSVDPDTPRAGTCAFRLVSQVGRGADQRLEPWERGLPLLPERGQGRPSAGDRTARHRWGAVSLWAPGGTVAMQPDAVLRPAGKSLSHTERQGSPGGHDRLSWRCRISRYWRGWTGRLMGHPFPRCARSGPGPLRPPGEDAGPLRPPGRTDGPVPAPSTVPAARVNPSIFVAHRRADVLTVGATP